MDLLYDADRGPKVSKGNYGERDQYSEASNYKSNESVWFFTVTELKSLNALSAGNA
jgi:hypothetical protein